ncbi:fatty acid synthase subunit beta domain-containing protein [Mumia sp. DW29H23]|uniref:fatty acid synthase subunit beta domain-containing protein n=1 Tax=Mumia sp. DW29H23 TaxID=3421241 RepID=UPI003D69A9BE
MTIIDTPTTRTTTHDHRTRLVDALNDATPYAIAFGGQGSPWLEPLSDLLRTYALGPQLHALCAEAEHRLSPVAGDLARIPLPFTPLAWADALAVAESAASDEAPAAPDTDLLTQPAVSVPGILLAQLAGIEALRLQGLDPTTSTPTAVVSHSQGVLAAEALAGHDSSEVLAVARLVGAAIQLTAQRRGLLGDTMLAVRRVDPAEVERLLAEVEGVDVDLALRNGRRTVVLSGPADDLVTVQRHLEREAQTQAALRERKVTGGTPFSPVFETLEPRAAFHHHGLTEAGDLVADWASACGIDPAWARDVATRAVIAPGDWVRDLESALDTGAEWILDLGPGNLASLLADYEATARGVGLVAPATRQGQRILTTPGAAPRRPLPWSAYAPKPVTLPDGRTVVETRFTRLTGRSPILLAGMTPTTVDAGIVAAAANAGFWAELAGGGQVTEGIFADRVDELTGLLEPGRTFAFNALYLDPYLWKMQLGQQRLVQRARANGAAVDAVVVSAGIPELPDAVALVEELREAGISYVVFKPGTVKQIREVLAIAREAAPVPIVVHVEGGKAGGHHSWEDLDDLLLTTYAQLRAQDNVVVCVGGGIGTPQAASEYLTGAWARRHGYPAMPLDGILVGTAAMATLEATTSPQVKEMLVATPGTPEWVGAGRAEAGMASGRSQLGADIHEIDNAASRAGRILDEVAGDAEAVAARRDEIIAAIAPTAKPYFGDVTTMTYAAWLARYAELAGAEPGENEITGAGAENWLDVTLRDRFHAMVQRAEARLADADHGDIATLFADADAVNDPHAAIGALLAAYPQATEVTLHPADVAFFVEVCRRPGKPVPFVPVLDADVRRWYRSDSLWQAHDARYPADAVCIIPGPVAVGGITRVDEPVADLLRRFEDETVDDVLTAGALTSRVVGRRRVDAADDVLGLVLAAPDVAWAGRTVRNPVHRLGVDWVIVEPSRAEHPETGAVLFTDGPDAVLEVPLGGDRSLSVRIEVADAADGGAPVVSATSAVSAMRSLVGVAAGGSLPATHDGTARATVTWSGDLGSDHAAVTDGAVVRGSRPAPDALVGLAWPSVFAVLGEARVPGSDVQVVEGMLDLVHLDHAIRLATDLPAEPTTLSVEARLAGVEDSGVGRVVTIDVNVRTESGDDLATLRERFAIRGRNGAADLSDPAVAGGAARGPVADTPRRTRAEKTLAAPTDLRAFAAVTGDHNPIHTSVAAARLAGLGDPIVHGMWLSATAQQMLGDRHVDGWTTRFLAPVRPGATVELKAVRTGLDAGAEILEVTARSEGELVLAATARIAPPRTAYAFPGQGIQHAGMGMAGYRRSKAAREIWDRADAHTRKVLGFSILTVVQDNPTVVVANGVTHKHPDGVLFLTQFTQVAMAVLGSAQIAELREAGAFVDDAVLAGHSVGEYNALSAVSGVISLEAVIEVVFQRGSVMHTLVPRDAEGRSDYRLAAIRPSQIGLADDEVTAYVARISEETGEFLEIANYNLRGSQYAIAGTVKGLEALEADIAKRRAEFGGKAAFILVPGIDVPFHSRVLRGGVPDFRHRLEELLPETIDPSILLGRYVPNLVPRPFTLDRAFVAEIAETVPSAPLEEVLADYDAWAATPGRLARRLLVELLAWQFASPVRWIETQDLMFGDLGVERFVEVGVANAPTVANLASATLKLPTSPDRPIEVVNIEREASVVFATDTDPEPAADEPVEAPAAETAPPSAGATPPKSADAATVPSSAAASASTADLGFDAADATTVLLAWWTKMRLDQIGAADSIESLCDGASSRRNQLLVDLGGELALGAIDGAADADLPTLSGQVKGLARAYKPFGPVLSSALGDHLAKILGPTGKRPSAITDRVTGVWQLGPGWASHVTAELALATREGSSVRGGAFGELGAPTSAAELDAAIDAAVQTVGARHGVAVAMPSAGGGDVTVDAAALGEITAGITGPDGVLASTARHLLKTLGLSEATAVSSDQDAADAAVLAQVEAELGNDWARLTAPAFDARRALLLDDRWASAREDVARLASGEPVVATVETFAGTGEDVASQARWWAERTEDTVLADRLTSLAEAALDTTPGTWSDDVAVVTGASTGSIAASVVGRLLAGGATVVATTSRLDQSKLRAFKELYRTHARAGARLWVVPANLASFADVDALASWVTEEQTTTSGGTTTVTKPALTPTLLFPFAAGRVAGDLTEVGSRSEVDMRILLWSVERLVAALATTGRAHDLASSLHVVLPGSPNRGTFGGDGAYGEAKAALDAITAKWSSEATWSERVTLVHAIIGWVRGTGLMGGNDPLVEAVERAGVRTWSTDEMADALLERATADVRAQARTAPVTADLTGGLGEADLDLGALAREASATATGSTRSADEAVATIAALAPSPAQLPARPTVSWPSISARPEDLVVIVGAGELGPYGSARTRFEYEVSAELSAAGVLELAWSTGLVAWDNGGWYDVESGEPVAESELHERYHDAVVERCGIRRYADDGALVDTSTPLLARAYLDEDITFSVGTEAAARAMYDADPERTVIAPGPDGDWTVTRKAGTEIRVPRRLALTRTIGGQIPTGFDPAVWGVPAEMLESLDRVAVWNLVCTVDAFLSSGFSPAELMRWVHPAAVASTQGTGMGGMTSMRSLYVDTLLGEAKQNDILQEALPNVIAAHVMQSYVGGYGAMIHPVAACATSAVSVEEGADKIRLGKADFVVAGGFDDLSTEGIVGFADMSATADSGVMLAKGIDPRYVSRANDRRRGGFVESQGGGTILLARGDVALRMGLPVLGVVAYAGSFADGVHTSIPAPGLGALASARGGAQSPLGRGLAALGLGADDVAVVSKHDTSTAANDPNESELHERIAASLGRTDGNPLFVVSQKTLTGHSKGGAAAFQMIGLCQVLSTQVLPPNRSLDCVDDALDENPHLVWLREPLAAPAPIRAGLVTSLGFGHVAALVAIAHPEAFLATLDASEREEYERAARAREVSGRLRLVRAMYGGPAPYQRPVGRRLGDSGVREREASILLDPQARLGADGTYAVGVGNAASAGGTSAPGAGDGTPSTP